MRILAKTLTGVSVDLDVEGITTIDEVKAKIRAQQGFEEHSFALLYRGKTLEREKTVADYQIQDKDTIHIKMYCGADPDGRRESYEKGTIKS